MDLISSQLRRLIACLVKCRINLRLHSQTSTVYFTLNNGYNHVSMQMLSLIHISKRGPLAHGVFLRELFSFLLSSFAYLGRGRPLPQSMIS